MLISVSTILLLTPSRPFCVVPQALFQPRLLVLIHLMPYPRAFLKAQSLLTHSPILLHRLLRIPSPRPILDSILVNNPSLHLAPLHRRHLRLMPILVHLLPRYDRVILVVDHRMLLRLWRDQVAVMDQPTPTLLHIWRLRTIFLPSRPLFPCSLTTILQ